MSEATPAAPGPLFHAIAFATLAHQFQYRKGTRVPYIVHPLSVARILIEHGCEETLAVAGVLHDTVEDTPVTLATIRSEFGERVAALVEAASEPDKALPWEERKRRTIEHVRDPRTSLDALLVECADKLDNIRAIRADLERDGEAVWTRFNRPREQQAWYYRGLAEAFLSRAGGEPSTALFGEFAREVEAVFGRVARDHAGHQR